MGRHRLVLLLDTTDRSRLVHRADSQPKEAYYFSHYSQESRYYHDPKTTRGMVEPLVNALIPETGKVLGYMQDLLKSSLDESSFKILKAMARTHAYFMQSIFSWSAIQKTSPLARIPKLLWARRWHP